MEDGLSQVVSDIAEAQIEELTVNPQKTPNPRLRHDANLKVAVDTVPVFFQGDQGTAEDGPSLRCLKLSASMGANDYQCGQCVINLDSCPFVPIYS